MPNVCYSYYIFKFINKESCEFAETKTKMLRNKNKLTHTFNHTQIHSFDVDIENSMQRSEVLQIINILQIHIHYILCGRCMLWLMAFLYIYTYNICICMRLENGLNFI